MVRGRKRIFQNLAGSCKKLRPNATTFWFHCASLGEFEQGRPIIEAIKKEDPNVNIILTFFSPSGYEVRKNYEHATLVSYLPLDSAQNARKFIDLTQPDMAIFVKYEFWYFYLRELHLRKIPLISVSTLLLPEFLPFRWYGGFYRKMLRLIDHYFAQDQQTAQLLHSIGIQNVEVAGDTRFDRVVDVKAKAKPIEVVETFKDQNRIMVIGSSWREDINVLKQFIDNHIQDLKFIIAPHNIHENELKEMEGFWKNALVRYSDAAKISEEKLKNVRILLVDNVGMLTSLYSYGHIAYVGGAFGKGLHNVLEPAVFGMPVFFGNKSYQKFREALLLLEKGGGFVIHDNRDLETQCVPFIQNDTLREQKGEIARNFVVQNAGATGQILEFLRANSYLPKIDNPL